MMKESMSKKTTLLFPSKIFMKYKIYTHGMAKPSETFAIKTGFCKL